MKKVLSIDLGGQSAKCAIIREDALIIDKFVIKTNLDDVVGNLYNEIIKHFDENKISMDEISGIGFGTPGFVHNGVVVLSGNLNWKNFDLKKELESKFKKTVVINNDANAAALGEYWVGGGKEYKDIIFYIIGTGVGGGIIINDNLIEGSTGFAAELGHGGDFQNKYKCTCGQDNCIEPLSSAIGMEKVLNEFAQNNVNSHIGKMRIEKGSSLKLIDISKLVISGDEDATSIIRESIKPLANHISTMVFALNPQAIIIGGGPSNMGDPFINIIKQEVDKHMLDFMNETFEIKVGILKNDAGMFGNAHAILKRLG